MSTHHPAPPCSVRPSVYATVRYERRGTVDESDGNTPLAAWPENVQQLAEDKSTFF